MTPPFIVAELSASHIGSLSRALEMIDAASQCGASAVKFQTWTPDGMALPGIVIDGGPWAGRELAELYREAHTPWDWHPILFERAKQRGLVPFSTPFDAESVEFLESLGCEIYKVASFEITDLPLIRRIAQTGKPMLISTGMATEAEINEARDAVALSVKANEVTLLKCTSAYPAQITAANLATLTDMPSRFWCNVGLSDHTLGHTAAVVAVALGATVIEKHFTLSRSHGGPDAAFSAEPHEFAALVQACRDAHAALGEVRYGPTEAEQASLQFRRGLWVVKDLQAGETITAQHVRSLRPAKGLAPKHLPDVIGRTCNTRASRGTPLTWEMLA